MPEALNQAPIDNRRAGLIRLRNTRSDVITIELEELDADGSVARTSGPTPLTKVRTITLGSIDDARLEYSDDVKADGAGIVSPEITIDGATFDRLMLKPAFAGLIKGLPPVIQHWSVG